MTAEQIGVNLLWLVPGQVGGSEESTLASLRALADLADPRVELRLFALDGLRHAHPDLVRTFPTTFLPAVQSSRPGRIAAESTWLAGQTRGLDLVHHAGGTAPPLRTAPYVLTVHDLQPLERAATHGALKRAYLRTAIPPSVRAARRVVVPSEYVRRSVLAHTSVDPAKVVVVPHGVHTLGDSTPEATVRSRYHLDGPIVLYPAITYPHKNHERLVAAFAQVTARHPDALLVLPGGRGSEEERLHDQIDRLGLAERVRRTGRVSAADVATLYRLASVVAVPSRYEGFGLPAVEAMAYGAPVVAARATALPEVVGDAGILVDPDDTTAWADAIIRLLEDGDLRGRLSAAGRDRAAAFTWKANAERLVDVYAAAT